MQKKNILFVISLACVMGLVACGNNGKGSQNVELVDSRRADAYVLVSGEMEGNEFVSYNEDKDFSSMYEAIEECINECEPGSYVYRKDSSEKKPLYVKQNRSDDYWFYYCDGSIADGSSPWVNGDTEWFQNEK